MTDIFFDFTTDPVLENNGTWKTLAGGGRILVARFGNKGFVKACDNLREQNAEALAKEGGDDLWETLRCGAMAQFILLNWEGITYKGDPVPYSTDKAKEFLSVKDFRIVVEAVAIDIDNYKVQAEATQTGN